MKLGCFMLTVLLLASLSGDAQTISFSGKKIPLQEIFSIIKKQTGFVFFYDATLLKNTKPVTVKWKNVTLENALNEICKDQPFSWLLEDKTITVIKKEIPVTKVGKPSSHPPPPIPVKGIITDLDGIPIKGVSVLISNSKQGTVSDDNGRFFIEANQNNLLVFSSVNYTTKEVRVEKAEMNIILQLQVKPLEALLVGGNFFVKTRKEITTSITVLDSKTLERIPENTLDQIFRGWVPGVNNFNVGANPEGFPNLTIRGPSLNELSRIAVYIDGIEYAGGSGYLFQLDKNNIDRIEIAKGPGAVAMYGTGSNGGIVQIFTKKPATDETIVNLTTSAGFYKSKWVKQDPFQQMHTIETSTGFKNASLTMGGSYRTVDAYLPDGGEKNKAFYTSAGLKIGKLQANMTARYNVRNFHEARDPFYDTAVNPRTDILINNIPAYQWLFVMPSPSRYRDGITETSIAAINLSHKTTKHWVNNLDAGFSINNTRQVPAGTDPLQRPYFSEKNKITTIRYSNVLTLPQLKNGLAVSIISGAEFKKYTASRTFTAATVAGTLKDINPANENYGAFVQVNPSWNNIYLTMAMRYEHNERFTNAWNPRVGLTTNFNAGSITLKPRISWGRGITAPGYEYKFGSRTSPLFVIYPNAGMKPQSQEGFDYGLELYDKKGRFKFEAVYYDNIVKDMFAQAFVGIHPPDTVFGFQWKNVGKLANKGWEFSGQLESGRFTVGGTFSIFNSTVLDTTGAFNTSLWYLVPGTGTGGQPKHTAGLNLTYKFNKLFGERDKGSVSFNITEVDGIETFEFKEYALDVAYGRRPYTPGVFGRIVETTAVFRVGLYTDYYIVNDLRFFVQGSNILNDYKYEFSNIFLTHGAAWLFGLKYNFSKSQ